MRIDPNTTIVDLAFNLSGSLAGIPAALSQLPAGERVGFDTLPMVWDDISDIGQTWTPNLEGVDVSVALDVYNPTAVRKAPYTTNLKSVNTATDLGNNLLPILVWDENLQRGSIEYTTGQLISSDADLRTVDFTPILGDSYALDSVGLFVYAMMIVYDENYDYVDFWTIAANTYREVDVSNASFFKVVIYSPNYTQGSLRIKPTNF